MKKIIIGVLIFFVFAAFVLLAARNFIVKAAVIKGIESLSGVRVELQKINIGIFSPTVEIGYLKLYNPSGFSEVLMADIPQVYVDYDLGGFLKNKVHLRKIKIEIKELSAVLNEQGRLNFNSLAVFMPKPGSGKPPEVKIDELFIKIGRVGYDTHMLELNIEETFRDVTEPSKVAGDILKKIMARVGLADIKQSAGKVLEGGGDSIKGAVRDIEDSAKASLDKAKEDLKNIFSQ